MSQIAPQRPPVQKGAISTKAEQRFTRTFRNEPCWGCGAQNDTIVPCHLNSVSMGHGTGIKTRGAAFPGCKMCHDLIDRRGEYSRPEYDGLRRDIVYRVAQVALMELTKRRGNV